MQAFDYIAADYDAHFTNSQIGRLQRERVWSLLVPIIETEQVANVLELNCGTGEDAIWMANKVDHIEATDISEKMIQMAQAKVDAQKIKNISCQVMAMEALSSHSGRYDLILSNFGGLNCLSPVQVRQLGSQIAHLLKPGGVFVAVIMSRFSWWESLYFLLKGRWSDIFRRRKKEAISARLGDNSQIDTFYFHPSEFSYEMPSDLEWQSTSSVGYFLPPSFLESFFAKRPRLLRFLNKLEYLVPKGKFFSAAADHYMLYFKRKG